jgi:DHA3 family macrolide efflux protein-like MFS transporter
MQANSAWKRQTALFLTSQTLSLFGSSLVQYALMWHVTLATKSGWAMTVFVLCGFLPMFLVSPFAGVWADRTDRKKLIILSDGMIALVTLALAAVFAAGADALWLVMLTAAVRAVGQAFQGPAVGALLPQFVPADRLAKVNGLSSALQSANMFVAPVAAGALMSFWPLERIFLLDVGTAALAIGLLSFFLKVPPHAKAAQAQTVSYWRDLKLGFRYIRDHRFLVPYFVSVAFFLVMVAPAAFLTPLQVARTFGDEVWRLTAIEMAFSVGMMAGGLVLGVWGGLRNRMATMAGAVGVMAACTLLLGVAPNFWLYLVPMGVFGLALPFYNTGAAVLLQEQVEPDFLGRVFSVFSMLSTSMMPLGMLLFGPLAEAVRVEVLLLASGAAMFGGLVLILANKRLMAAGLPPAAVPPAGLAPAADAAPPSDPRA